MDLGLFFSKIVGEATVPICESSFRFEQQLVATATVCQQKAKISYVHPPPRHLSPVIRTRHPSSTTHHPPPTNHHPSSIIHHPSSIIHNHLIL